MVFLIKTLSRLERHVTLTFSLADIHQEIIKRLKTHAKNIKIRGFRQGKVPIKIVAMQYSNQIKTEIINNKINSTVQDIAFKNNLRIVGYKKIEHKTNDNYIICDVVFEIYPDIIIGDLSKLEIEKVIFTLTEEDIDKAVEILRKQHVSYLTYQEKNTQNNFYKNQLAKNGDRVTVNFHGKINGVEFQGSKANNFVFVLGEHHMLLEFEAAILGLKINESKQFSLVFPNEYHNKNIAGKTAEFTVTLKHLEHPQFPKIDIAFAKSLGIKNGNIIKMREYIKRNLEYESHIRIHEKIKNNVMNALINISTCEAPKILVEQDVKYLSDIILQDMKEGNIHTTDIELSKDLLLKQAERRVCLRLILAEIIKINNLHITEKEIYAQIEKFTQYYKNPQKIKKYYLNNYNSFIKIKNFLLEENIINYVLSKSKILEKTITFNELISNEIV